MLSVLLIWQPRKIKAMIAMIAMRARISAYSARPWPSSLRNDGIRAIRWDTRLGTSFPQKLSGSAEAEPRYVASDGHVKVPRPDALTVQNERPPVG